MRLTRVEEPDGEADKENGMTTLVLGATGATGRLLVEQLLHRGHRVRAMARSPERLPAAIRHHDHLSVIHASVLDLSDDELARHVDGCTAVASCLGHTLTWRGMFGQPRRLVTDTARRLCAAIAANESATPTRYVLMNAAGNSNRDLDEPVPLGHRVIIGLLRVLLPPHVDNEAAADFLRTGIGQDHPAIEWAAVRPDSLIDAADVTEYDLHPSPIRSAILDAGRTSRINVAHFMAGLISDDATWGRWKGRMPVIYNRDAPAPRHPIT